MLLCYQPLPFPELDQLKWQGCTHMQGWRNARIHSWSTDPRPALVTSTPAAICITCFAAVCNLLCGFVAICFVASATVSVHLKLTAVQLYCNYGSRTYFVKDSACKAKCSATVLQLLVLNLLCGSIKSVCAGKANWSAPALKLQRQRARFTAESGQGQGCQLQQGQGCQLKQGQADFRL